MVLTRRRTGGSSIGGVQSDTKANHENSFRDEDDDDSDFLSLRQSRSRPTRSVGPLLSPSAPQHENDYNYHHTLRSSRQRHRSKDHYSNGSALEKRQLRHSRQSKERDDHTRSLRSIGLDEELSSEEDAIATISASSSRSRVSKLSPRRSSRNRKTVFEKLSMSGIEGELEHKIFESSYNEESHKSKGKINPELRDLLVGQGKDPDDSENLEQPDIYTTIKARHRKRRPRRFFDDFELATNKKVTTTEEEDVDDPDASVCQEDEEQEEDEEEEDDENGDDDHEDEEMDRRYSLRTNRAQPLRLIYELQREPRRQAPGLFDHLPRSPVRRKAITTRRNHPASPFQRRSSRRTNSQGASSGSTSSSDDETKFEKRKKRSMMKARSRCMPMNLSQNDLAKHGFSKERGKIGSSLADVDPMAVDKSVMFASVGGHKKHIRALKEMVVFPLLYPEVFEKFHISPPRGCLFYGPPGTGKTLMARALANECSIEGRKVAFFMRKGADCLSKWVGESERQLRLLFDQAYQMRPAIIFFDEIDGLAPVRSSRQDQIHSSIVSTLLALMDGLDSRGEIIVIGATNRIDSIDPALRRPGRFDREFLFPLPDQKARRTIFNIHTSKWVPPLSSCLLDELAEKSVGYCGADIKSACTEAAIVALRRRYPQIYLSKDKLKLDVSSIDITAVDFYKSMKSIVPTAQRSTNNPARALSRSLHPLLINSLLALVRQLTSIFPPAKRMSKLLKHERRPLPEVDSGRDNTDHASLLEEDSDSDADMGIPHPVSSPRTNGLNFSTSSLTNVPSFFASYREMTVHRPRLLVCGGPGEGQTQHLASALLHDLEGVTVHLLDIPSMYGLQAQSPEEACSQLFREALRTSPSIVYLPRAALWWNTASETVRCTFYSLLNSLPPSTPVLLIATVDQRFDQVPSSFSAFFDSRTELYETRRPSADERNAFFAPVFLEYAIRPPAIKRQPVAELEALEKAPPPAPTKLTKEELKRIEEQEESTMRSLRLFLRDVLTRLAQDRRFKAFLKPVDPDEVPDYADVISNPMDLSTMVTKIDQHKYHNVKEFQQDIDLICSNALEYNPDHCAEDKAIRHRACLLKDMSHAIIEEDLDPNFEKVCNEVTEARKRRKADPAKYAPSFYRVLPAPKKTGIAQEDPGSAGKSNSNRRPHGEFSARRSSRKRKKCSRWALGFVRTKKRKIQLDTTEDKEEPENDKDQEENKDNHQEEEEAESLSNGLTTSEDSKQDAISEDADVTNDDHNVTNDGATPEATTPDPERDVLFDEMSEAETGDAEFSSLEESTVPPPEGSTAADEVGDCLSVDQPIKDLSEEDSMDAPTVSEIKEEKMSDGKEDLAPGGENVDDAVKENALGDQELETSRPEITKTEPTSNGADAMETNWETCNGHADEHHNNKAEKDDGVTSRPMTLRSRTRTSSVVTPPPPLVVDNQKLKELLTHTVAVTSSCCVAELEKLHSILTRCVYLHRRDYDKTQLTKDLGESVSAFLKGVHRSDSGVVM